MPPVITIRADVHATIPHELQVELANVTECLRVVSTLAAEALETDVHEFDDRLPHDDDLLALQLQTDLFATIFQETFGQQPSIPGRVFTTLRGYRNRHPENRPAAEACLFASMLACHHLTRALDLPNASDSTFHDEIDHLLFACRAAVEWFVSIVSDNIAGLCFRDEADAILDAIVTGGELPAFVTEEELAEQRRKAAAWCEREKAFEGESLRRQIQILYALKDKSPQSRAWIADRCNRADDDMLRRDLRSLVHSCNLEKDGDLYLVADDVFPGVCVPALAV